MHIPNAYTITVEANKLFEDKNFLPQCWLKASDILSILSTHYAPQQSIDMNKASVNPFFSLIKNILKRREESDTYLTHICRHCWSRKSSIKIDEMAFVSCKSRLTTSTAGKSHSVG